ncbi:hypothetical protein BDP27DRAFT_1443763 [Rhodocollybia butyracea]|uniref:Uncharacterized protein n=1 Tax=Rhodocollybia butyracea TaxID=206335 RepID=A0A9P5Q650_9AGAR|nr:hypothetical protein BDP27DRAFT_1443763 [Rhodocollybia butyracea]
MPFSPNNGEILAEIFNILPKASGPILWVIVSITVSMTLLQRLLFPCVTLSSLRKTVDAVDELLKGHEAGILTMHTSIVSDGCVDCTDCLRRCIDYKENWLRINKVAHRIYEHDRNSSWNIYISLTRVCMISSSYKRMCALQDDIKHSIALSSKQHNDWKLNSTQPRRRNVSNPQFSVGIQ